MAKTIKEDIRQAFSDGNMLTKVILINVFTFIALVFIKAFFAGSFSTVLSHIAISSDFYTTLMQPWSIISHAFVHIGLMHLLFNMLVYYYFGSIVGDFLGDNKILPLYLVGAIGGAITYSLYGVLNTGSIAYGASGSVMAVVGAASFLAPNYKFNLVLLGPVSIKYIAIAYVVIDLAMISDQSNTGGHVAHLGGLASGILFIYLLKKGINLGLPIDWLIIFTKNILNPKKKSPLKMAFKNKDQQLKKNIKNKIPQKDVDKILDKVKKNGYESLSKEEKEFLFIASKSVEE